MTGFHPTRSFWRSGERPESTHDRDRGAPHGTAPPTPPGIRVAYHGGSTELSWGQEHRVGPMRPPWPGYIDTVEWWDRRLRAPATPRKCTSQRKRFRAEGLMRSGTSVSDSRISPRTSQPPQRPLRGPVQAFSDARPSAVNDQSWPKGELLLSAVGMPERTFTSALPNGSTRPFAVTRAGCRIRLLMHPSGPSRLVRFR
jgi:hypothetical protein